MPAKKDEERDKSEGKRDVVGWRTICKVESLDNFSWPLGVANVVEGHNTSKKCQIARQIDIALPKLFLNLHYDAKVFFVFLPESNFKFSKQQLKLFAQAVNVASVSFKKY